LHDRVKVEKLAGDPFVVHHGSISKELREEAEVNLNPDSNDGHLFQHAGNGDRYWRVQAIGQVDTHGALLRWFSVSSVRTA